MEPFHRNAFAPDVRSNCVDYPQGREFSLDSQGACQIHAIDRAWWKREALMLLQFGGHAIDNFPHDWRNAIEGKSGPGRSLRPIGQVAIGIHTAAVQLRLSS